MERRALEGRASAGNLPRRGFPVIGIDDERVAGVGEVDPHLVGTSRRRIGLHQRGRRVRGRRRSGRRSSTACRPAGPPRLACAPSVPARPERRSGGLRPPPPGRERGIASRSDGSRTGRRGCGGRRRCARRARRRSFPGRAGGPPRAVRGSASASSRRVRSRAPRPGTTMHPGGFATAARCSSARRTSRVTSPAAPARPRPARSGPAASRAARPAPPRGPLRPRRAGGERWTPGPRQA